MDIITDLTSLDNFIDAYFEQFRSGNNTPVERVTINRKELQGFIKWLFATQLSIELEQEKDMNFVGTMDSYADVLKTSKVNVDNWGNRIMPDTGILDKPKYTLIKFCKDWSDKFDVEGFAIYEGSVEEAVDFVEHNIFALSEDFGSYYFGTNEGWEAGERDWLDANQDHEYVPISEEQYYTIKKLFGKAYGVFPTPNYD